MKAKKGSYRVEEIRAKYNRPAALEDLEYMRTLLAGVCTVGEGLADGYLPEIPPRPARPDRHADFDPDALFDLLGEALRGEDYPF